MARLAILRASPFIQLLAGAFHLRERVSTPAAFGGEFGMFAYERLRASARVVVPVADLHDEISHPAEEAEVSAWLWGFSLGAAASRQAGFAMSPSLQYLNLVGGDFGHALGVQVPFEWLSRSGFRVGFDFSLLYGFGGTYRTPPCPSGSSCSTPSSTEDRPASAGFVINFLLGHVFSMPDSD